MIANDNTIAIEGSADFFKSSGENSVKVGKTLAKPVLKNSRQVLNITARVRRAVAFRNPKAALSTSLEVINFYHARKRLQFGKFDWFFAI